MVTVVVPTKDRRHLLEQTLSSVLDQRGVDIAVVVVDDGSQDGTAEWVRACADSRVRLLRNDRPLGVAGARNRGIAVAEGTWLALCDDDDLWAPDKLRLQLDGAAACGRGWALGGVLNFEPRSGLVLSARPPSPEYVVAHLPWRNLVAGGCSNVVVRADVLTLAGGFDPALRILADWDLWIRLARTGPPAVVDAPVVGFRLHGASMSSDPTGLLAEFAVVLARSVDLRGGRDAGAGWLHRWSGQTALRAGRRWQAVRAFSRAVRCGDLSSVARIPMAALGPWAATELARRRHPLAPAYRDAAEDWLLPRARLTDGVQGRARGAEGVP